MYFFKAAFQSGMFNRSLSNYADGETLDPYKTPLATTEISTLDVGNIRMQAVPAELLPELAIGGYTDPNQPYTDLEQIVSDDNPNPPDLSRRPGLYIKDRMASEHIWIIDLAMMNLGILYHLTTTNCQKPFLTLMKQQGIITKRQTLSGPSAYPIIETEIHRLLEWMNQ